MEKIKLRGEYAHINQEKKEIHVRIHKPQGRSFSLSDKVLNLTKSGYTIIVHLPDRKEKIDQERAHFMVETVKSKFPNSKPWYRFWFNMSPKQEQLMFV